MAEYAPTSTGRTGNIQQWQAPVASRYRITVAGAAGGLGTKKFGLRGRGAILSGDFELAQGEILDLLVGQLPTDNDLTVGGGGGTFVAKAPADTRYIVYVYREGLRPVDREIMEYLILTCHTPIRAMSEAEFRSNSVWDNVAMVVIGYPAGDGATYAGVGSSTSADFSTMPFPVVSFCRHTSRNALGMQASNSSGGVTVTALTLEPGAPDLGWNLPTTITLDEGCERSQMLPAEGVNSGQIIYRGTGGSDNDIAIVYHEQNGHPRIHWGVYRLLKAGSGLQDLFVAMVGIRSEQYQPLIVAGGGGGNNVGDFPYGEDVADASLTENGKAGIAEDRDNRAGLGGTGGMGGQYDQVDRGQGGGGFYGFGVSDHLDGSAGNGEYAGFPFMAGGFGGHLNANVQGGYGGGGSASATTGWGVCSGGGGYSGGGAAYAASAALGATGGGGGSFNAGDNPQHVGWNDGDGWVLIQQLHTVGNRARSASGDPVDEVIVREWMSKELVLRSVPNEHGDWTADLLDGMYEIHYYHSESQPAIHGPYTVGP